MLVTLDKLLELNELKSISVIAGKNGLNREVSWTNTIETSELIGFVHEHELIFTTGINARNKEGEMSEIVKSVCEVGAAGIVINLGPYINHITDDIIEFADKNSFPVLTLPWEVRLADTSYAICEYIIKNGNKRRKSDDIVRAGDIFKNIIFNQDDVYVNSGGIERYGYMNDQEYCIMVCCVDGNRSEKDKLSISRTIDSGLSNQALRQVCFIKDNYLVFVIPCRENGTCKNVRLGKIAAASLKNNKTDFDPNTVYIGTGRYYRGFINLKESYMEALKVIKIKRNNPLSSLNVFDYEDLGIYKLFSDLSEQPGVMSYYHDVLGKLEEYDQINATGYMDFLRLYLSEDGSPTKIGLRLFMHRNTVLYKIKKIEEILGCDLSSVQSKTEIMAAFIIKDIL